VSGTTSNSSLAIFVKEVHRDFNSPVHVFQHDSTILPSSFQVRNSLDRITDRVHVSVPGHSGIPGNEVAARITRSLNHKTP